jgi:hypothetical protein
MSSSSGFSELDILTVSNLQSGTGETVLSAHRPDIMEVRVHLNTEEMSVVLRLAICLFPARHRSSHSAPPAPPLPVTTATSSPIASEVSSDILLEK